MALYRHAYGTAANLPNRSISVGDPLSPTDIKKRFNLNELPISRNRFTGPNTWQEKEKEQLRIKKMRYLYLYLLDLCALRWQWDNLESEPTATIMEREDLNV